MKNIIKSWKNIIWLLAVFVSLGMHGEVQAACGTDTVTRNSITYGTVVGADGHCWLDRNLGATRVATVYNDSAAYGWYFEWGRSDDGHQKTSSVTTTTLSSSDTPGHAKFILPPSSPYDWRSPQNNNLWQGVNGINNPCPTGFRLPTQLELSVLFSSANIVNMATAFSSSLKLPAPGYRSWDGVFNAQGGVGHYWSSGINGVNAQEIYATSSAVTAIAQTRNIGNSVRCVGDALPTSAPAVTTQAITSITPTNAIGNGNITSTGGENPTRYIEWGITSGAYTNSCSASTGSTGAYTCSISGLSPNTPYYVRAKATNSAGTAYGSQVSFTTSATASTVTTQASTSITDTTAIGNGNIVTTGGNNPTRTIEWGATSGSNYTNSCTAGTGGIGTYSCAMTGLTPGTTYYVRAKATNSAGTSYGNEVSFTTLQAKATVSTSPTTNILTTAATGNANITDIGGGNPMREIQWGTTSGNYTNSCSALTGSTGNYSCQLTGLTPNTTYYLRAMATNSAGTSYGNEVSFQTLPSQVTISEPDTAKMTNAVTTNYMSVNSGTITATPQITTNTNIIIADGIVKMDIPSNTQITKTDSGNFNFQNFVAQSATNIVKKTMANSISAVKIGVLNTKITFSQPITVTIDVDSGYNGRTLDVLYQNDGETTWHSQTSCTITSGKCVFTTNHATTYSVNGSGNMAGETGINLNTDIQEVIALDCGSTTINLGNITPGTPITGSSTCTATTNANGGYNLSVRRDDATSTLKKNTENSVIISDLTPWDPTTPNSNAWSGNGLGFTVFHSTANKNSAWWGTGTTLTDSNNKYAGFNTAQTDIMRNSTYASSSTATDIGYMLNVPPTQKSGAYSGSVTYQAVTTP